MTERRDIAKREPGLNMAMFPAAVDAGEAKPITREAAISLINWAERYGLDAWANHVCYMYGKPYITETGAIANAHKDRRYSGYSLSPLTETELKEAGYQDAVAGWKCSVILWDYKGNVTEYGVVTESELARLKNSARHNLQFSPEGKGLTKEGLEERLNDKLSHLPLFRVPSSIARTRAIRRAHLAAVPLSAEISIEEPQPEPSPVSQQTTGIDNQPKGLTNEEHAKSLWD